jgi:hypothetical protein
MEEETGTSPVLNWISDPLDFSQTLKNEKKKFRIEIRF